MYIIVMFIFLVLVEERRYYVIFWKGSYRLLGFMSYGLELSWFF